MFKKKVFISMTIFSILMFLTALIKTQTRIIEKNIYSHQIKISELNNNMEAIKNLDKYFSRPVLQMIVMQPLEVIQSATGYDIMATVKGGGLSGQAGALRHGISKALSIYDSGLRGALKKVGFIRRDSRVVERKKYGRRKARRSFQFSKR